jgi:hypothetical protein
MSVGPASTVAAAPLATRRRAARALAPGLAALGCLGTIGLHMLIVAQGPTWRSPLLAGEWLFNLLLAGTIMLYALALGRRVLGPLAHLSEDALADGLACLGLGFGLLSAAILAAGLLHLYHGPLFLLAGAALTLLLRRDLRAILAGAAAAVFAWRRAGCPTAPYRGQRLALIVLGLVLVHVLARSMLPQADWDAVVYHLASVKLYLAQHAVVPLPDMPLANAPAAEEMLYLLGLAAGTDGLGKVLSLVFGLLLALAAFSLARRLSTPAAAWYAILLLLATTWIVQVLPQTFTDFAAGFLLVAAVNDVAAAGDLPAGRDHGAGKGRHGRGAWDLSHAGLDSRATGLALRAGALAGCGAACKLSTLPALPAICGALALAAWLRPGSAGGRGARAVVLAGLAGTAALVPLAPWLVKNAVWFGRPFYPFGLAATNPTTGDGQFVLASSVSLTAHARWLVESLGDFMLRDIGLLSPAILAGLLLWRRPGQRATLLCLAVLLALWFVFVPYFAPPRYYIGLAGVAQATSLAGAATMGARWPQQAGPRRLLHLTLAGYLLWQCLNLFVAEWTLLGDSRLGQVVAGTISREQYLAAAMRPYSAERWASQHLPSGASVAIVNVITGYYLDHHPYLNDWYGSRLARLRDPHTRPAELALWCHADVRYAIVDRGDGRPEIGAGDHPQPLTSFTWTHTPGLTPRLLFSAHGVDVLAVRPCL